MSLQVAGTARTRMQQHLTTRQNSAKRRAYLSNVRASGRSFLMLFQSLFVNF
jgi:hypothetical protein